jgi:gliding motility-associated-like protein
MIRKRSLTVFIFLLFFSADILSQINCTVPLPPVLTAVSVKPETGLTELSWSASPSDNIAAYIVYTYNDGNGFPVDTIWNSLARSYSLNSTASKYMSMAYVVTAHRLSAVEGMPGCTSPLSNALQTIYCEAELDTCNSKISIRWNRYNDYPRHVREYMILVSMDGSSFTDSYTTSDNSFEISGFRVNTAYCYAVKAVFDDGGFSTSNKSCIQTSMLRPPEWINADYATVNDHNSISLSFTIDPLSEIRYFILERKSGDESSFQRIAAPSARNGIVEYIDEMADPRKINYYRLVAMNSCNVPVAVSNLSSNIVLSFEVSGHDLNLSWNPYRQWSGSLYSYDLLINTGSGFKPELFFASDTAYTVDLEDIMYEISGGQVCFRISVSESGNPHGVLGKSISAPVCYEPAENITVPDVFTPNNDLMNDLFRPVLSFTPVEYYLMISDRNGKVLFETRDFNTSWNGASASDHAQSVCLWFLRIKTPSGNKITRTGTVTIIR